MRKPREPMQPTCRCRRPRDQAHRRWQLMAAMAERLPKFAACEPARQRVVWLAVPSAPRALLLPEAALWDYEVMRVVALCDCVTQSAGTARRDPGAHDPMPQAMQARLRTLCRRYIQVARVFSHGDGAIASARAGAGP